MPAPCADGEAAAFGAAHRAAGRIAHGLREADADVAADGVVLSLDHADGDLLDGVGSPLVAGEHPALAARLRVGDAGAVAAVLLAHAQSVGVTQQVIEGERRQVAVGCGRDGGAARRRLVEPARCLPEDLVEVAHVDDALVVRIGVVAKQLVGDPQRLVGQRRLGRHGARLERGHRLLDRGEEQVGSRVAGRHGGIVVAAATGQQQDRRQRHERQEPFPLL